MPRNGKYVERVYRGWSQDDPDLISFVVKVKETDLYLRVKGEAGERENLCRRVEDMVRQVRKSLEAYIALDPVFRTTLVPHAVPAHAPKIARRMAEAAAAAGVGPMAAVAGAIAAAVGEDLAEDTSEVIVENGGDIFLASTKPRVVAVFAGESPFSGRIGIRLSPGQFPAGVCTSAGTVGPSLSLGVADAAMIVSPDPALADAVATGAGNRVQGPGDVQAAVDWAMTVPGVSGALVVKDDQLAAAGDLELVRLAQTCPGRSSRNVI